MKATVEIMKLISVDQHLDIGDNILSKCTFNGHRELTIEMSGRVSLDAIGTLFIIITETTSGMIEIKPLKQ